MTFEESLSKYKEVGFVEKVFHPIVSISGLPNVCLGESVVFETGQLGQVNALHDNLVEVILLSKQVLKTGTKAARGGAKLSINLTPEIVGKTVDVLGRQLEGEALPDGEMRSIDTAPSGIINRRKITRRLITGVSLVDMLVPIGKGQRELVIGDRKTGKTNFLMQTITTQVREGSICIYAAIGKKKTEIMRTREILDKLEVRDKTIIVAASSEDSPGEIHICPYTAMTIAEYVRDQGRDVLLVLDDMSTHAKFYRELSLLSRRFPGRDSYPGDIFHVHSKLLERGGNFMIDDKEVSITSLPVAETVLGDIAGYIQTNLMSMTDGHIYFDGDYFFKGRRPAVNPFVSVTRVGRQTLSKLVRDGGRILLDLLNSYERTQSFLKFGAELGENSRQILLLGERVLAFFNQPLTSIVPAPLQSVLLAMLLGGMWDGLHVGKVLENYQNNPNIQKLVEAMYEKTEEMAKLLEETRRNSETLNKLLV